ncbi:MAG TPA: polysaccharide deacetylase family protein, partial [Bacillota bacterium]
MSYQSLAVWANARGGSNPDLVWYVSTDEPVIALTFDDGPDPKYTPAVLKALDQYGAKAT